MGVVPPSPQRFVLGLSFLLRGSHMTKFFGAASTMTKVIRLAFGDFLTNFWLLCEKKWKGDPISGGECESWSFSSVYKNLGVQHTLGAKIWSSEQVDLGGHNFTNRSSWLVDESSLHFFSPNTGEIAVENVLVRFVCLHPFHRYSPSKIEVIGNWVQFCMFLAPEIFEGRPPKCLDQKFSLVQTRVQNFAPINWQSSEIPQRTRKKERLLWNIGPVWKLSFTGELIILLSMSDVILLEKRQGETRKLPRL